jgi:diguanylate cyclase (GGDEF)-like protein
MATRTPRTPRTRRPKATDERRLEVLYEVSRRLTAIHETNEMLTLIVNEAARLLGVEATGLRLIEGDELVLRARTESAAAVMLRTRLKFGESLSGLVVARNEPVVVEDLASDTRYDTAHKRAAADLGFHGFLAVPLRANATVIGVLNLYSKQRRRFGEDEIRLAGALADQAALAIEKDRLVRDARDRAGHLLALARLNQLVSSSLDTDDVLTAIARAAAALVAVPCVLVWSADEARRTLTLRAFSDPQLAVDFPATAITFDDASAGWVATHRRTLDIPDIAADRRIRHGASGWALARGLNAATFLPIVFQDTLLGVVGLGATAPLDHSTDARELLDGFVAQAAVAIRNARLYEQIRSANERLERRNRDLDTLTHMAEVLQACLTEDEAYVVVARFAERLFAEGSGAIFVTSASRNLVEARASWGGFPAEEWGLFKPEDCWALRRGRAHAVDDTANGVRCEHLPRPLPATTLCLPLAAQGESLGVLYLSTGGTPREGSVGEGKQQLAQTVAEQLGLAVANLKLRETLRNQSIRDPLTGLFNRRYMEETLERELRRAERNQHPLSVVMLDLDRFKGFNDTFGHDTGDVVLAEFGRLVRASVRGADVVCRYGGEEFVLILPDATAEDSLRRVEELRLATAQLYVRHREQSIGAPSFSGGIASFPANGDKAEDLLRAADTALYRAKTTGRSRILIAETPQL